MEFSSDTRWMMPMANPTAFEMTGDQRAEREAAVKAATRLNAMIQLLCPESARGPAAGREGVCGMAA